MINCDIDNPSSSILAFNSNPFASSVWYLVAFFPFPPPLPSPPLWELLILVHRLQQTPHQRPWKDIPSLDRQLGFTQLFPKLRLLGLPASEGASPRHRSFAHRPGNSQRAETTSSVFEIDGDERCKSPSCKSCMSIPRQTDHASLWCVSVVQHPLAF